MVRPFLKSTNAYARTQAQKQPRDELLRTFRWPRPRGFNLAKDTVDHWARTEPGRVALLEPKGRKATYAQLSVQSMKWATVLRAYGISPGDRVGILFPQSLEAALAHLAVYRLGAIALPLSTLFGSDAVRYRLEHGEAKVLLADTEALEALKGAIPDGVKILPGKLFGFLRRGPPQTPNPTPPGPRTPPS